MTWALPKVFQQTCKRCCFEHVIIYIHYIFKKSVGWKVKNQIDICNIQEWKIRYTVGKRTNVNRYQFKVISCLFLTGCWRYFGKPEYDKRTEKHLTTPIRPAYVTSSVFYDFAVRSENVFLLQRKISVNTSLLWKTFGG